MKRAKFARWVRFVLVAAVWVVFAATFARQWSGDSKIWDRVFGVPPMDGHFADLAQIAAAVQSAQHGLDPYLTNPYDMGHRPFIYPRIWLYAFSALRITPARISAVGIALACSFLVTVSWLIVRQSDLWASLFIGVAACSSATAFAIERGNTDLLVFCFVVLAAELMCRGGWWFLVAASVLKIYPIFALVAAAVVGRKTRLLFLAMIVGTAGILAQHKQVSYDQSLPHGYGFKEIDVAMGKLPESLRSSFSAHAEAYRVVWDSFLALLCCSGLATGGIYARKRLSASVQSGAEGTERPRPQDGYAFVLCASIFVGTFLFSTNYDYRLIFLIPLLPFLTAQARTGAGKLPRILGATGLALTLAGVDRAMAGHIPWPRLFLFVKAAAHVDLWALLWTVCFFLGLIAFDRYHHGGEVPESGIRNPLQVGLAKESA